MKEYIYSKKEKKKKEEFNNKYAYVERVSRARFVDFTHLFSFFISLQKTNCERCDYMWCVDMKDRYSTVKCTLENKWPFHEKFLLVACFVNTAFGPFVFERIENSFTSGNII